MPRATAAPIERNPSWYLNEHRNTYGETGVGVPIMGPDAPTPRWVAQTFTPSRAHTLFYIRFQTGNLGTLTTALTFELQETAGGVPNGTVLATGTLPVSGIVGSFTWCKIYMSPKVELSVGVLYAIVAKYLSGGDNNTQWYGTNGGDAAQGAWYSGNEGASWTAVTTTVSYWPYTVQVDCYFEEWEGLLLARTLSTVAPQSSRVIAQAYGTARGGPPNDNTNVLVVGSQSLGAQTFRAEQAITLTRVDVRIFRVGLPGTGIVSVRRAAGWPGTIGPSTGADLGSASFNANSLTTSGSWTGGELKSLLISPAVRLAPGSMYALMLRGLTSTDVGLKNIRWPVAGTQRQTFNGRLYKTRKSVGGSWDPQSPGTRQVVWGRFSTFGYLIPERSLDP